MNEANRESDKADNKIIEDVNIVGWSVVMIEATDYLPSFAYTIGLWKSYRHPEIIAFGLSVKALQAIVNIAGENIKGGKTYEAGNIYADFFISGDAQMVSVDKQNISDYLGYAIWFHNGPAFPALQLVWVDRNNRFPWHEDYDKELLYHQPLLDRNANFKFYEAKNLGVFTTRQWLEQNKPILRAVHDEDGDWQFLTGDQMPDDIKIAGLEQLILKDTTLNDVFNLDYGEHAERTAIGEKWERNRSISDE